MFNTFIPLVLEKDAPNHLKSVLDRLPLQIMYFTFVRPILEYSDIIWYNVPLEQKQQQDKIQCEASHIVTDYSELISLDGPTKRNRWKKLAYRSYKHNHFVFKNVSWPGASLLQLGTGIW